MTDWTEGYVADIDYVYGYYNELNPLRHKFAFINQGLASPKISTACELGFGQGLSVNIHSAASNVEWWGTDFNPSQSAFAQNLGEVSGKKVHLSDEAFAEFCQRTDLPEFDYIGMHGIWTWISDENRAIIVDFVRRKLKVGGVFYISYNTQPGWAAMIPLRKLFVEHSQVMGSQGQGAVARVDAALDFTEQLFAVNPAYTRANPMVVTRFNEIKKQNRHYLAHEYFNKDWQPMLIADMAKWLSSSKLDYACSANYLNHVDVVNLSDEQKTFLENIKAPIFKETVRDYITNQQFRTDYWVKGRSAVSSFECIELARQQNVILTKLRSQVPMKIAGVLGETNLLQHIYDPILDVLADHRVKTIGEIEEAVKPMGLNIAQVWQAIVMLVANKVVSAAQEINDITEAKKRTDIFNLHLLNAAKTSSEIAYLASPVVGGGVSVSRFEQLFLLARLEGHEHIDQWADFAYRIIVSQNQRLIKEGQILSTAEENIAEMRQLANIFATEHLQVLKGLGIA
jgi:hypothetical protein